MRMDAMVFNEGKGIWRVLTSPSMRGLGDLVREQSDRVTIKPDEGSALQGIHCGPYGNMEDAMAAIGTHLGGQCRAAAARRW